MTIINQEFVEAFKDYPIRSQEHLTDPLVIVKLFDTCGSATWYLTEYDPEHKIAFGYVTGLQFDEWGDVSIEELETIMIPTTKVCRIERDLYFSQKPISHYIPALARED